MNCSTNITYRIKSSFFDIFSRHKTLLTISFLCLLFSIVIAIATISGNCENIDIYNCLDKNIICFLAGDISCFRLFLVYILSDICVFGLILLCSSSKVFILVDFVIIIVKNFCCIFNISLFVLIYGIKGFLFGLIAFLVLTICEIIIYFILICLCKENCCQYRNNQSFWKNVLVLLLMLILINFVWMIIFKFISPIFVIII